MQIVDGIAIVDNVFTPLQCKEWIIEFEQNPDKHSTGDFLGGSIDKNLKDVVEMSFNHLTQVTPKYNDILVEYLNEYTKDSGWNTNSLWTSCSTKWNGAKYKKYFKKSGHYNLVHQEKDGWVELSNRLFSVLLYLNTVSEGGETVFPIHNVSCQPIVGRICIWPSGFPYLHYGKEPISDNKYAM